MKHLFVPYDIARQLKEKGFDEECLAMYSDDSEWYLYDHSTDQIFKNSTESFIAAKHITAPLYQQVIDWFRDKHNVIISVEPRKNGVFKGNREYFISGEWRSNYTEDYMDYYGALTKAIEEALKLI